MDWALVMGEVCVCVVKVVGRGILLAILSGLFVPLPRFPFWAFFYPFNSNQRGQKHCWEKAREGRTQDRRQRKGA